MSDTGNTKDCHPQIFRFLHLKNVTWQTYLISFTVQYCFLFHFVCLELRCFTRLISSNLTNHYWSTLMKKLMQTYIIIISGSILNVSTVHLNGICHLIWCYLSKPVLGRHHVLSWHYSIFPEGVSAYTGFTFWTPIS